MADCDSRGSRFLGNVPEVTSNQRVIDRFLAWQREKGSSETTINSYMTDLLQLAQFLVGIQLTNATEHELSEFVGQLAASVKPRSVMRKIATFRSFFRFLLMDSVITGDPTVRIHSVKSESRLPQHLEPDEIDKLLPLNGSAGKDELARRDHAILEVLYGSGLRVSELASATVLDADFVQGWIIVHGKGNKERMVPLRGRALLAVKDYLALRKKNSVWLFSNKNGSPLTRQRVWQIVNKCSATIGRHVHPHMFRHSCATHMVQRGAGLRHVQILLGHSEIETTEIYAHINPEWVKKNYFDFHPRAGWKSRQMRLELPMVKPIPPGIAICSQCQKPALSGMTYCGLHAQLNRQASARSYAKRFATELATVRTDRPQYCDSRSAQQLRK